MDIDYRSGLDKVRLRAVGSSWYLEFLTYEARLLSSLSAYEEHGDEQKLSSISSIVKQLNKLTLKHLKKSFNDFCKEESTSEQTDILPEPLPPLPQTPISSHSSSNLSLSQVAPKKMRRWAVLVGVNTYEDHNCYGDLKYCASDVQKLRDVLLAGGFEEDTIQLLSEMGSQLPKREFILPTLQTVASYTEPDDLLLFYFGGHGLAEDGESYLIPCNAVGMSLEDIAIRVSRVKKIIEKAKARKKVLIFDACHSGTLKGVRDVNIMQEEFINNIRQDAEGLAILSSCDQGQKSYDWEEQQCGVYTYYLLEALEGKAVSTQDDPITVSKVSQYVYSHVKQWANQRRVFQTPILNYLVSGEIELVEYQPQDNKKKIVEENSLAESSIVLLEEARRSLTFWQSLVEQIQTQLSHDQDRWSSSLQELIKRFREKPCSVTSDGDNFQLMTEQMQQIVLKINYLYEQMKGLISQLERFCAIEQSGKLQQEKKSLLSKLSDLQKEFIKAQDTLFF